MGDVRPTLERLTVADVARVFSVRVSQLETLTKEHRSGFNGQFDFLGAAARAAARPAGAAASDPQKPPHFCMAANAERVLGLEVLNATMVWFKVDKDDAPIVAEGKIAEGKTCAIKDAPTEIGLNFKKPFILETAFSDCNVLSAIVEYTPHGLIGIDSLDLRHLIKRYPSIALAHGMENAPTAWKTVIDVRVRTLGRALVLARIAAAQAGPFDLNVLRRLGQHWCASDQEKERKEAEHQLAITENVAHYVNPFVQYVVPAFLCGDVDGVADLSEPWSITHLLVAFEPGELTVVSPPSPVVAGSCHSTDTQNFGTNNRGTRGLSSATRLCSCTLATCRRTPSTRRISRGRFFSRTSHGLSCPSLARLQNLRVSLNLVGRRTS